MNFTKRTPKSFTDIMKEQQEEKKMSIRRVSRVKKEKESWVKNPSKKSTKSFRDIMNEEVEISKKEKILKKKEAEERENKRKEEDKLYMKKILKREKELDEKYRKKKLHENQVIEELSKEVEGSDYNEKLFKKCEYYVNKHKRNSSLTIGLVISMLKNENYEIWKKEQDIKHVNLSVDFSVNLPSQANYEEFYTLVQDIFMYRFEPMFGDKSGIYKKINLDFYRALFNMTFNCKVKVRSHDKMVEGVNQFINTPITHPNPSNDIVYQAGKKLIVFLFSMSTIKDDEKINKYIIENEVADKVLKIPNSFMIANTTGCLLQYKKELNTQVRYCMSLYKKIYNELK
jgi:hypothetical protein